MRISDTDRQRAVDELRRHFAAGRLDVDEFSARLGKALEASTLEDLDKLMSDLPMIRIADPVGSTGTGGTTRLPLRGAAGGSTLPALSGSRRPALAVAITVAVVVGAVILAIASSWVGSAALLVGWLAGMIQSRLRG
jgi:Domain of unknown function (DUF1707)